MDWVSEFLRQRREKGLYRELHPVSRLPGGKIAVSGREYVDLSSNDYLGFSTHPELIKASVEYAQKWGSGSAASRLLSGDLEIHHLLERDTARFKGKESALIFNSGYQANIGIISALCGRDDVIFSDKLNHASISDGIILSRAKFFRFEHNDTNHLETFLKKERKRHKRALIITESVFSMEGDRASLKDIVYLKEKYDCIFMADEAHATGIFGKDRAGIVSEEGLTGRVDIIMGTFGKALGSFGAYAACDSILSEYFINACRSFVYTTALPPSVIGANIRALKLVREEPERAETLLKNAAYFRSKLKGEARGSSQIVPLITGGSEAALEKSGRLMKSGYYALPIRPPTVPEGEARLRFSVCYFHTRDQLESVLEAVNG